jgi:hypothetical protein
MMLVEVLLIGLDVPVAVAGTAVVVGVLVPAVALRNPPWTGRGVWWWVACLLWWRAAAVAGSAAPMPALSTIRAAVIVPRKRSVNMFNPFWFVT